MRTRAPALAPAFIPALAVAGLLALPACGDDGGRRLTTPDGSFCDVVLAWSDAVTGTINHFSRVSPAAADTAARRGLYLEAWDGLGDLSRWVDEAAERAPEATRPELHRAADRVRDEITYGRDRASGLPDASYEYASVSNGTLFTSTEKARDVVYQTLDDLRAALGEATVPPTCGRHTEPVTLPIMTAP